MSEQEIPQRPQAAPMVYRCPHHKCDWWARWDPYDPKDQAEADAVISAHQAKHLMER